MTFDGLPIIIGWELTLACNLRCHHCGSSAGLPRKDELSLQEALDLCDQMPDLLVQEVDFTGGEPLMRPDWPQIAGRLSQLGIATQIITNGVSLTPQVVSQMADLGIACVGISLDGLEQTHDHIRNYPGLFRKVLAGIEKVQNAGLRLAVLTTVNRRNIDQLPALLELLCEIGVRQWQLQPVFPLGRARESDDLVLSDDLYMRIGDFFTASAPIALEKGLSFELADSFGYGTACDIRPMDWQGCPAGRIGFGVTSNGLVKGCLSMPDALIEADVRQSSLWDIWFHPDAFAYNRGFCLDNLGPACSGCDRAAFCMGGCTSMSLGATGDFHGDPYCFYGITHRDSWQASA